MKMGEQIDKVSKKFVVLSDRDIRFAKKQHRRYLRRARKDVSKPTPQSNRYSGWIG